VVKKEENRKMQPLLTRGRLLAGVLGLCCLAMPTVSAQAQSWTAYNDCVYDPGLDAYGTDPNGQSVHYIGTNVTAFGIGALAGDHQSPPGVGYSASSGELIDHRAEA
jgi:hypothetical protein